MFESNCDRPIKESGDFNVGQKREREREREKEKTVDYDLWLFQGLSGHEYLALSIK